MKVFAIGQGKNFSDVFVNLALKSHELFDKCDAILVIENQEGPFAEDIQNLDEIVSSELSRIVPVISLKKDNFKVIGLQYPIHELGRIKMPQKTRCKVYQRI